MASGEEFTARPCRNSDGVDMFQGEVGFIEHALDQSRQGGDVTARRDFWHHAAPHGEIIRLTGDGLGQHRAAIDHQRCSSFITT